MSTSLDRWRGWWLVPELAAAAFLVIVAVPFVGPVASTHQLRAEVGPVVVTLAGAAPTVTIARSGAGYADRVRAMMPDEYEQFCFGGLRDDAIAAAVRSRFVADVSDEG